MVSEWRLEKGGHDGRPTVERLFIAEALDGGEQSSTARVLT